MSRLSVIGESVIGESVVGKSVIGESVVGESVFQRSSSQPSGGVGYVVWHVAEPKGRIKNNFPIWPKALLTVA